ncbi:cyclin-dependent kinase 2-interacting protein isoform X1 [Excalfactoria chinensis]|uniref:cyclin-dependent kinase 2-interacting protein isoform X1 n=1 Tax=Excalfactoria chinensis TaxID=46218 RepID=UPI003B3BD364
MAEPGGSWGWAGEEGGGALWPVVGACIKNLSLISATLICFRMFAMNFPFLSHIAKSPADGTPRRPVLSVSARKIKDNAADWHNLMMKWERLNDNGFTTANKIVNMKISEQFQDNKLEITCDNSITESEKPSPKYNEELDNCCTELLETLKKMTKIQLKMEKLSSTTKGVCDLEKYHHGAGGCTAPLFHTWPTVYFYEVSLKLSEMYKKELQLKETIVQEIAHSTDQDLMMVYLSSWLYQPYLDNSSKLLLEAMLLETGHRQC